MAWFEDGAACTYFGSDLSSCLRAVGWLAKRKPFTTGPMDRPAYDKLEELRKGFLQARWRWLLFNHFLGYHECDLCSESNAAEGIKNLFIPGPGFIFVAPELILHYIKAHAYQPPFEFSQAVLACPPVPSAAYLEAVSANGGGVLLAPGT
jgi:hypothetical protein